MYLRQGIDPIIGASFQGNPGHHQDDMPLGRVFVVFFNHGTFEAKKCRPQKDPTKFQTLFSIQVHVPVPAIFSFCSWARNRKRYKRFTRGALNPRKNPARKATNVNTFGIKHAPGFLILGAESLSTKRAIERFMYSGPLELKREVGPLKMFGWTTFGLPLLCNFGPIFSGLFAVSFCWGMYFISFWPFGSLFPFILALWAFLSLWPCGPYFILAFLAFISLNWLFGSSFLLGLSFWSFGLWFRPLGLHFLLSWPFLFWSFVLFFYFGLLGFHFGLLGLSLYFLWF